MDSLQVAYILGVVLAAVGLGAGYFLRERLTSARARTAQRDTEKLLADATRRHKEMLLEARDEALKIRAAAEAENRERRLEVQRMERRLQQKEENLDRKLESLERKERGLQQKEKELEARYQEVDNVKAEQRLELQRVSGLSREEAEALILERVGQEMREECARRARQIEMEAREEAEQRARKIVAVAIQRYAAEQAVESTVSVVPLPSDDMKGRIIGREGRNIRALEAATGVDLIVDDTPDAVTLSGFDPVRREVARVALTKLVMDGRIHPARIEEVVAKAKQELEASVREAGEEATVEAGVHGMHPEILKMLGRLKYRTSYGQNQLTHSVEVAHIAAMIAAEMGADVNVGRRAALLHDLGKAISHEMEGPHHIVGAEFARRFGESPKVVEAIIGHHEGEGDPQSVEAVIVAAADAISGARPGARRETVEQYIKRLEALEHVASSFPGVDRCFAVQAGREVRIIVKPEEVDDLGAVRLARDIVRKVEETLQYPGQVKVTVVRETRAVDYAR